MKLPQERAVKVGRLTWRVIETRGQKNGPVLVMLPGTLGTASIFADAIKALGARVRMVSVTYPMIDDITRLADSLAGLMDKLGITRASIVGSSLGGFLAQHFAARHADRVDRLILGNTLWDPALTRQVVGRLPVDALRAHPPRMHRDMVVNSVRSWPETDPLTASLKTLLIDSGTRLLSARAMKARVLAVQAAPAVPPLTLAHERITIIDCMDDPLLPRAVQDSVVKRYPRARHVRLSGGGHYPYVMRAEEYNAVLEQALAPA
ncbi:MAG: alpha/beta hydrolase [Rhodoferax sp.]|nr:alpha/beta hydrolase [Rhodoferax sp.]MBP9929450.1 alpha/beta hydrolase [Rhodoferax sp.]